MAGGAVEDGAWKCTIILLGCLGCVQVSIFGLVLFAPEFITQLDFLPSPSPAPRFNTDGDIHIFDLDRLYLVETDWQWPSECELKLSPSDDCTSLAEKHLSTNIQHQLQVNDVVVSLSELPDYTSRGVLVLSAASVLFFTYI